MVFKEFCGKQLSALGFGTMRLPLQDKTYADIDEELTAKMFDYAITHGVNYFDTAWGYHDGKSELVVGKILKNYARDKIFLADKFPGYDLANMDKVRTIFEEQLKKCQVDYFDFYMFHNVCELNIADYLDERHGIADYLVEQKRNGRIKHLGCSMHGSLDVMKRFFDKYAEHLEFCQLQVNYIDYSFQNAEKKIALATEYGLPIWVMEPLRGGKLANIGQSDADTLCSLRHGETAVGFAFRFLQSIPQVKIVLSGMSDFDQVKANIKTFETDAPLTPVEMQVVLGIADGMIKKTALPCTECRYCTSHCPKGINIPEIIKLYNEHVFTGGGFLAPMAMGAIEKEKQPSACIGCGGCRAVCPQQIDIPGMMKDFDARLQ